MGAGNSSGVVISRRALQRRLSMDVKKITTAAAKLKIHTKRKDKIHSDKSQKQQPEKAFVKEEERPVEKTKTAEDLKTKSKPLPCRGLPHHIVAATRVERKWTLTDLLQNLGTYVQRHCTHLQVVPSASEIAMWVRCADRALQLNGWTVNSFLMESHVVCTYMLVAMALEQFAVKSLTDVKELVLMCLYISYTYNANEISYPLRPFLVKHDRAAFWDKCMSVSLGASSNLLRLHQQRTYYVDVLISLKRVTSL